MDPIAGLVPGKKQPSTALIALGAAAAGVFAGYLLWELPPVRAAVLKTALKALPDAQPIVPQQLAPPLPAQLMQADVAQEKVPPGVMPGSPLPAIRYIELVKPTGFSPVTIGKIQVYDLSGRNVVLGNPQVKAEMSSSAEGHYAMRAIDADPESYAESQPGEVDGARWFRLDLGPTPPVIATVALINRPDGFRDWWKETLVFFLDDQRRIVASFGLQATDVIKITRAELTARYLELQKSQQIPAPP